MNQKQMSARSSTAKRQKLEVQEELNYDDVAKENGAEERNGEENGHWEDQEETLLALVEHRTKELENLHRRISYYQHQFAEVERRLEESNRKLARLRDRESTVLSDVSLARDPRTLSKGSKLKGLVPATDSHSKSLSKPQNELVTPAPNLKVLKSTVAKSETPSSSGVEARCPKKKVAKQLTSADRNGTDKAAENEISKFERRERKELIPLIGRSSSVCKLQCHSSNHIFSQHKRKLRCLVLCPLNDQLFITSSLDGMVKLWQLQSRGMSASLLSTTDCLSSKLRRWPEDAAFHPLGKSLFSVYTADAGDSQISILNLNKSTGPSRVTFLEYKPHVKGIINSIKFMPWDHTCFATGGSDHAVILWSEKDEENQWLPKCLHRNLHSAAVMGVSGMQNSNVVLSVGADKRILGFDVQAGRAGFKHQIDYKCMSVLANPCDFNLFLVQSGEPESQLRLFDIRLPRSELHSFGWKQDSSESQSALINQSWSPDGLYVTSGSADPIIHIFDVRYNCRKPSQSIRAHEKRVFKAEWHYSQPALISISSDLNIGFHKVL